MVKVIYFSAPWCGPCKSYSPIVERVCTELGVELEKVSIDTDEGQQIASNEGIRGVPAIILTKDGMWQDQRQGVMSESALVKMIRDVL